MFSAAFFIVIVVNCQGFVNQRDRGLDFKVFRELLQAVYDVPAYYDHSNCFFV